MDVRFKMKDFFFDRPAVLDYINPIAQQGLRYFGLRVRKAAIKSIPDAANFFDHSHPGNPPKSHAGQLRNRIFAAWDKDSRSVVIGSELFRPMTGAPEVMEYGGTVKTPRFFFARKAKKAQVTVAARPYMHPAFDLYADDLPKYIAGTIGGLNLNP